MRRNRTVRFSLLRRTAHSSVPGRMTRLRAASRPRTFIAERRAALKITARCCRLIIWICQKILLLPPPGDRISSLASKFDFHSFFLLMRYILHLPFRCFCGFCFRALSLHHSGLRHFHCERYRRGRRRYSAHILRCFAERRCR